MATTKTKIQTKNARCVGPTKPEEKLDWYRERFRFVPELEDLAEFFSLAGNDTRLKIIYLLKEIGEVCVCDIAEVLEISLSAVSQQLSKLKAYGIVKSRRDSQTIYYALTAHPLLANILEMLKQTSV
ncbi:MAG: hypothetical protein NVSMB68_07420 [Thermoanaerobaculia bacterium]